MALDFSEPGWMIVQMSNYIKTMLHDASDDMDGKAVTPAVGQLFNVNQTDPVLLPSNKREIFVHLVIQRLYLSQCGCHNIRTAILFVIWMTE